MILILISILSLVFVFLVFLLVSAFLVCSLFDLLCRLCFIRHQFHKSNPFVCHRRKPTTFRWWEEPCILITKLSFPLDMTCYNLLPVFVCIGDVDIITLFLSLFPAAGWFLFNTFPASSQAVICISRLGIFSLPVSCSYVLRRLFSCLFHSP